MATRTVVCPECAEPLAYGRLACPSCGALLASVAGGHRRAEPLTGTELVEESVLLADSPADLALPGPEVSGSGLEEESDAPLDRVTAAPAAPTPAAPAWATVPTPNPSIPSVLRDWPEPPDLETLAGVPTEAGAADLEVAAEDDREATRSPATQTSATPAPASAAPASAAPSSAYVPAGAYMPPSAVFADADPGPPTVAGGVAVGASGAGGASGAAVARAPRPGDAPLLADLPFDAPNDLPGWLVASGAAVGTIGFFLPWAFRVIGSSGDGYFSQWGFGALMNVPIFGLLLLTLGLAVLPNRIPAWLRSGAVPLVLGGVLLGTAWPYVLYGPLNGRFGSLLEAFAGLLLIVGGVLTLRAGRHVQGLPRV